MAVASLLAVPASAAAIGPGEFLFSAYPNKAHAVQTTKHVITVTGSKVECNVVNLDSATQSGPASELTLTPTYSECTAFGFGGATVATNGCTYKLTQPEGAADAWEGGLAIACPEGKKITITVSVPFIAKCKVEIGPQTAAGAVSYSNDTAAGELDLSFALSGIDDTVAESTGSCPLTLGKHETATYTGGSTANAAEGGSVAIGLYNPTQFKYSVYPNKAHAAQTQHIFTITGSEVGCKAANFDSSSQSEPATELTLTPTYSECTAFGFGGATVATNGCTYKLSQPEGAADNWEGGLAIACPEGKKITITVSVPFIAKCRVEVGGQTPAGAVAYVNDTGSGRIKSAVALSGIVATVAESTGSCPLTLGSHKTATYTGSSTVNAGEGGSIAINESGELVFAKYPNKAHAAQTQHIFTITGSEAQCKTVDFDSSSQNGPSGDLALTPTYSECTAFGFAGATVTTNGCTYRLTQPEGSADNWQGGFAIACPEGKKIVILVSVPFIAKCKVEIGQQFSPGAVDYLNDTGPGRINFTVALSSIDATVAESTGSCPLTLGSHESATYTGASITSATEGGGLVIE